jgi:hypothetical protein
MMVSFLLILVILAAQVSCSTAASFPSIPEIPFISHLVRTVKSSSSSSSSGSYTPLLFFKVPPGIIPECDAMEKEICALERELHVKVERLDVVRDPNAEALLSILTQKSPPFLYHRESLQVIHVPGAGPKGNSKKGGNAAAAASSEDEESSSPSDGFVGRIDKDRLRAWAKGRYLPGLSVVSISGNSGGNSKPIVLSQDETAMDQRELLEDMMLSPLQKSGKTIIQQTTEKKAAEAAAAAVAARDQ